MYSTRVHVYTLNREVARHADILATILARMSARKSVSVSVSVSCRRRGMPAYIDGRDQDGSIHHTIIIVYYAKWQHRQKYNYIHKIQKIYRSTDRLLRHAACSVVTKRLTSSTRPTTSRKKNYDIKFENVFTFI